MKLGKTLLWWLLCYVAVIAVTYLVHLTGLDVVDQWGAQIFYISLLFLFILPVLFVIWLFFGN